MDYNHDIAVLSASASITESECFLLFFFIGLVGFIAYIGQQMRLIRRKLLEVAHVLQNIGRLIPIVRKKILKICSVLHNIHFAGIAFVNQLKKRVYKKKNNTNHQNHKQNNFQHRYPIRIRKQTVFYGVND
jgi:type II secretory pathway component PulF